MFDHYDATGTLRLFARENAPDVADPPKAYAALGHPPDLVAYELGLE